MKNIAIIPARGGSKRLPNKNIMLLGGIPLLAHSIKYALQDVIVDDVYVSTDDDAITDIALQYGAKVIHRPKSLSGDLEPTVSALKHVLQNCPKSYDNVILLQPTNPLRTTALLTDSFAAYLKQGADSLFTVTQSKHKLGKIVDSKFLPFNYEPGQRSQDLAPLYFENGLLYISTAKLILEGKIMSENAIPFIMEHPFAHVDIDTQSDFDYAEYLYEQFY